LTSSLTKRIYEKALELGFDLVGCAPVQPLQAERNALEEYLEKGWHGNMEWLHSAKEALLYPDHVVKNSRSVISLAINYFNEEWKHPSQDLYGSFSRYTYGKDYHATIESKLAALKQFLNKEAACEARAYVDDAPFLEKKWAALAGIGWRGKNSLIYTENYGSWIFLGELVTDIELEYSESNDEDRCGDCTICMEACPTGAIESPYCLNASKCIAYHTIETKGSVAEPFRSLIGNALYGCDICQEVCPLNKTAQPTQEELFLPQKHILDLSLHDLMDLNEGQFKELFKESAVIRGGLRRLLGNVALIFGNTHSEDVIQSLIKLFNEDDQVVKIHAAWALGQIPGVEAKKALENLLEMDGREAVRKEIRKSLDSLV
jgi:epoxyqueuosine reductase